MYEWSKGIVKKIRDANCLAINELRMVEIVLRTHEIHEEIMNECIAVSEDNKYELEHRMPMPKKRDNM